MTCDVAILVLTTVQPCLENREAIVTSFVYLADEDPCTLLWSLVTHHYLKETFSYLNRILSRERDYSVVGWLTGYFNFQLNTFLVVVTSYLLDMVSNS